MSMVGKVRLELAEQRVDGAADDYLNLVLNHSGQDLEDGSGTSGTQHTTGWSVNAGTVTGRNDIAAGYAGKYALDFRGNGTLPSLIITGPVFAVAAGSRVTVSAYYALPAGGAAGKVQAWITF